MRKLAFGKQAFDNLETLCGCTPGAMAALAYTFTSTDRCRFGNNEIPVRALAPLRRRVCPICHADGRPRDRLLDLPVYAACHHHGCWLVGDCSTCGRRFRHTQPMRVDCPVCETEFPPIAEPADEFALQLACEIARLDSELPPSIGAPYRSLGDLLTGLERAIRIDLPRSLLGRFTLTFHMQSDAELRQMVGPAWRWIKDRSSFEAQLSTMVSSRRLALPHSPSTMWHLPFLRILDLNEDCELTRQMKQWYAEAATALMDAPHSGPANLLAERQTIKTIASALNLPIPTCSTLARAGFFGEFSSREKSAGLEKVFPSAAIDDLFRKLNGASSDDSASWALEPMSFAEACAFHADASPIGMAAILTGILNGRFRAVVRPGFDFYSILINREDLLATRDVGEADALPLNLAADAMRIRRATLFRLLQGNLIVSSRGPYRGRNQLLVSQSEIARFNSNFVLASDLSKQFGRHHVMLVERLLFAGIEPALAPSPGKPFPYVFRLTDLAGNAVQAALDDPTFRPRSDARIGKQLPKEPPDSLVESRDAANRLGVSRKVLRTLIRNGFLEEHRSQWNRANRYFLTSKTIENYEERYRKNPALASTSEAKAFLEVEHADFILYYIRAGRLSIIRDGAGGEYVDRKALETMAPCTDDLVTYHQAVVKFQITRAQFRNLSRKHSVVAVTAERSKRRLYSRAAIAQALKTAVGDRLSG